MTTAPVAPPAAPRARPGPAGVALTLGPAVILAGWIIMRAGGSQTTGAASGWVAAHAIWLAGWAMFGPVIAELFRRARVRPRSALVASVVAGAGLIAVLGQTIVDIVIGVAASDRARMHELFQRAYDIPGVRSVLYGFGPILLILGLAVLFVQAAAVRRLPGRAAVLAVLGMVLISLDTAVGSPARLIVMPAGLLCLWFALDALRRTRS